MNCRSEISTDDFLRYWLCGISIHPNYYHAYDRPAPGTYRPFLSLGAKAVTFCTVIGSESIPSDLSRSLVSLSTSIGLSADEARAETSGTYLFISQCHTEEEEVKVEKA